jgi:hypothetical protein
MSHDVLALLSEDVGQSFVDSVGKVWVFLQTTSAFVIICRLWITYVVERSIGSDGTALVEQTLLADNGGDTTGRQSSRSSADQDGELLEELSLLERCLDTEEVREDTNDGKQLVGRVTERSAGHTYYVHIELTFPSNSRKQCRRHKPSPACRCSDPRTGLQCR